MQQRAFAVHEGFLLHRNKDLGRVTAQRFTEKPRGRYPDHREGMALHNEG